MPEFTISIVERDAVRCAGLKVRTTMAKAAEDCSNLWEKDFGPRMATFPNCPGESFGVSIMLDSEAFDYWAVIPLAPGVDVPEGMDVLTIPGGMYAECAVASLKELGDAYTYVYGPWAAAQEKYAINMQGASVERYTEEYMKTGALTIYCPVVEK